MPQPLGESRASWSNVRILPPALRRRLRARLLTRRAHTWGTQATGVVRVPRTATQGLLGLPVHCPGPAGVPAAYSASPPPPPTTGGSFLSSRQPFLPLYF